MRSWPAGTRARFKSVGFPRQALPVSPRGYAPYPSAVAAHGIFQAQPLDFATIKLFLNHITNLLKRRTVDQRGCQNVDPMSRPHAGGQTRSERVSAVQHRPCLLRRCRATRPGTRCFLPRRVEKVVSEPRQNNGDTHLLAPLLATDRWARAATKCLAAACFSADFAACSGRPGVGAIAA